jgi:hypothetical protein
MMKTYAPKGLAGDDLRPILDELHASPAQVAKFLRVTERSVWRWLSDGSAPYAALAALWHETPTGRHASAVDVGNELVVVRGLAHANGDALARESQRLARLVAISDTGAGNDPFFAGPFTTNLIGGCAVDSNHEALTAPAVAHPGIRL